MEGFEGYVGIRLWDDQLAKDVAFAVLLVQIIIFAWIYHANYPLFGKMKGEIFQIKERHSLFEDVSGNEVLVRIFVVFQSLLLCSLTIFMFSRTYGYIDAPDISGNLLAIGVIFAVLFLFYLFKQLLYKLLGTTFATQKQYQAWQTGYRAVTDFWGILLYIPVVFLVVADTAVWIPFSLFILLYILCRTAIFYRTTRLFSITGVGFLYIILYLCAQEILPLFFLYEGVNYLYTFY